MKNIAFMFPGQGSQVVGMGKEFYDDSQDIQALYEQADQLLGISITDLMFNGPKETLTKTENTQPALLLSSVAVHRLLQKEGIEPDMVVGHSLGEYSALVAAGVLTVEDALLLVQKRGQLMEKAFPAGKGSMAAVLGMSQDVLESCIENMETDEVIDLANINCPGQIVISGTKEGIDQVIPVLKEKGAKRVISLNVSGPFHSRLMKKANEDFAVELDKVPFQTATMPVYANVTAQPVTEADEVKQLLLQQLHSPVQFEQSIRNMMDKGIDAFVEVGTGKVLSGLVKKINRRMPTFAVQDKESFAKFVAWYKEEA